MFRHTSKLGGIPGYQSSPSLAAEKLFQGNFSWGANSLHFLLSGLGSAGALQELQSFQDSCQNLFLFARQVPTSSCRAAAELGHSPRSAKLSSAFSSEQESQGTAPAATSTKKDGFTSGGEQLEAHAPNCSSRVREHSRIPGVQLFTECKRYRDLQTLVFHAQV